MCVCVGGVGGVGGSLRWKGVENPVALSGPTYDEEATVAHTHVIETLGSHHSIYSTFMCFVLKDCVEFPWVSA